MTGIQWLLEEEGGWWDAVVWARGITAPELAARLGGVPHSIPAPLTDREALAIVWDEQHAAAVGVAEVRVTADAVDQSDLCQRLCHASQTIRELRVRHHPRDVDVTESIRRTRCRRADQLRT
ncbi:hypothetical protein [Streptomyces sp. NPDC049813]|uniref:hypothetical protein n=1 Tax=Streptomyces sp. NPDC049813 TaxID=3365597 RepID=UPI0037BD4821